MGKSALRRLALAIAVALATGASLLFSYGGFPWVDGPACDIRKDILANLRDQDGASLLNAVSFAGADDAARKARCPDCRRLRPFREARDSYESMANTELASLLSGSETAIGMAVAAGMPAQNTLLGTLVDAAEGCWNDE